MIEIGTRVRVKNNPERIGLVEQVKETEGTKVYKVRFPDRVTNYSETSLIEFRENPEVIDNFLANYFGEFNEFQKTLTHLKLVNSHKIQNNVYSINTSRTEFYEYQFKPLMKFIGSAKRRVMICDEVGLGKTIEAGLIINELEARKELGRVLIVVPANLRLKWAQEMLHRFNQNFTVIGSREFRGIIEEEATYRNKYKQNRFIISLESIRSKTVSQTIEETDYQWDLLIVDEAHSLRNSSHQHNVIKKLSAFCEAMVFLTATPVHTERKNLFNILNILDEQQFEYVDSFENQLSQNEPIVKALNMISQMPPKVDEAHDLLTGVQNSYVNNEIYQEVMAGLSSHKSRKWDSSTEELEHMVSIQRSLSDLHFMGNIYTRTRKRDVMINRPLRRAHIHSISFSEQEQRFYNALIRSVKESLTKAFPNSIFTLFSVQRMLSSSLPAHSKKFIAKYLTQAPTQDWIDELEENGDDVILGEKLPFTDSKLTKLIELITEIKEHSNKVIIFAFYIPTLTYLENCLREAGYQTYIMHGTLKIDRSRLIDDFRNDTGFSIMLSSRVGSEGIDLQFCDTIINYDLPWNPMEIEQRIGRIDRIGQKSEVLHIYNLWMSDTIDDEIVIRLYQRISLFESSIGLLEPIMGEVIERITKNVFFTSLSDEEKKSKYLEEERVLVQKMEDMKLLEDRSTEIFSLDYFYEHEIRNIKGKHRYIAPQQLFKYLSGFICTRYPDSIVKYDFQNNLGELYLCEGFMRDVHTRGDEIDLPFMYYNKRPVKFTMDSNVAFEDSNLTFISIMHPLVSYITKRYSDEEGGLINTNSFSVHQEDLLLKELDIKKGIYFYFMYLGTITGLKESSYLVPVILDVTLSPIGSSEYCEAIMAALIDKGRASLHGFACDDPDYVRQAFEIANDTFSESFMRTFNRYKARHNLVLERKRESLRFNYDRRIRIQEDELEKLQQQMESADKHKFRVDMIHGKIKKLRTNQEITLARLKAEENIDFEFHEPILGGVFEVQ
ncbi:MAG: DEAD/DEAH box helicase family protein [Candidatus Cloacimonetes bacterium]|nr:DEAD/DEAH box helicase family protein [Candidatus Cloacimonadota bacterium]MDD3143226.1 SNF2-related protein [Candidatus Cloacimonadota bacterium]MDD3534032.1 SNF2-related protein [Candidatus Cloacimonadota bacterium]